MWRLSLSQLRVLGFIYVDLSMIRRQDGTQKLIEILSDRHTAGIWKGDWLLQNPCLPPISNPDEGLEI